VAKELLDVGMDGVNVSLQMSLRSESHLANLAFSILDVLMNTSGVGRQRSFEAERLLTDRTLIVFRLLVDRLNVRF